jgi:hypothetical protein
MEKILHLYKNDINIILKNYSIYSNIQQNLKDSLTFNFTPLNIPSKTPGLHVLCS